MSAHQRGGRGIGQCGRDTGPGAGNRSGGVEGRQVTIGTGLQHGEEPAQRNVETALRGVPPDTCLRRLSERSGGWICDDPKGIRIQNHLWLVPGNPDDRVFLYPVDPMLYMWLDTSHTVHGWRLDTARLRRLLQHNPAPVYDVLGEFFRVSGEVGYRSERIERAFAQTIVDVLGTEGLAEMLNSTDAELRRVGIRMLKHFENDGDAAPNTEA